MKKCHGRRKILPSPLSNLCAREEPHRHRFPFVPLKKVEKSLLFPPPFPENNDGTPPEAHSASAGLEVREISAREPLIFGLGAELGCHFGWGDGRRR